MRAPGVGDVLEGLRSGRIRGEEVRLRTAARLLESSFHLELLKAMRRTVPEGGATSGESGRETFEALLDQHVADAAALRSERGLGAALQRYFSSVPEAEETPERSP